MVYMDYWCNPDQLVGIFCYPRFRGPKSTKWVIDFDHAGNHFCIFAPAAKEIQVRLSGQDGFSLGFGQSVVHQCGGIFYGVAAKVI